MKKPRGQVWLNLGCGVHAFKDFINVDNFFTLKDLKGKKGIFGQAKVDKGAEFLKADMCDLPIASNSVDYIECLEAIEHIPFNRVELAIKEMHRVLKPGGKTVIFTHDFDDIAKMWTDYIANRPWDSNNFWAILNIIFGNQITEGEFHRSAFNLTYFNGLMQACGFTDFKMELFPRGTFPPKFRGAKWPKHTMGSAMILVEATK